LTVGDVNTLEVEGVTVEAKLEFFDLAARRAEKAAAE